MNKKSTTCIRGIAALGIVLCHMQYKGNLFREVGYMCVGIFFFFTSFNLAYLYYNKPNYEKLFMLKKIKRVYIPYIFVNIIYIFLYGSGNGQILFKILGLKLTSSILWYVDRVMLIYIVYYCGIGIFRSAIQKHRYLFGVCTWLVSGVLFIPIAHDPNFVFPISFIVGWIVALNIDKIKEFANFRTIIVMFISFVVLKIFSFTGILSFMLIDSFFSPVIIGLMCGLISIYKEINIKLFYYLGIISYEMYLIHSITVIWFNQHYEKVGLILSIGLYIITTIFVSFVLSKIVKMFDRMMNMYEKINNDKF